MSQVIPSSSRPPHAPDSIGTSGIGEGAGTVVVTTAPASSRAPSDAPPSRKRKRLRKEEIVATATVLFAERGYEGASMGDLAERVGLRKASLFHHFPSKEVLYATVLNVLLESLQNAIMAAVRAEGSFFERLDTLNGAITETFGAEPHAARLLVREALDNGPFMRQHIDVAAHGVLGAALEFARLGQQDGNIRADLDPHHLIVSLIGVHLMPFALSGLVERFTGVSPFERSAIEERKRAITQQLHAICISKPLPQDR